MDNTQIILERLGVIEQNMATKEDVANMTRLTALQAKYDRLQENMQLVMNHLQLQASN